MKVKAADNLAPVRNQLSDLVAPDSRVIEFGCGKGDLLFKLSPKIKFGLGIDISQKRIAWAREQKEKRQAFNIEFSCEEAGRHFEPPDTYDYSIASLFFHVIRPSECNYLINKMINFSDTALICGFTHPETLRQKSLLWFDQRFRGHYRNFREYQKNGYMEGILARSSSPGYVIYDTAIPILKIYETEPEQHVREIH